MTVIDEICALCGEPERADDPFTREHVPARQFFPKSMRPGLNLWADVPTHKSCNGDSQPHEDYFFPAAYPLIANANPEMAAVLLVELRRRAANHPPTRRLLRRILRTSQNTTDGGIILPSGTVSLSLEIDRMKHVAIKIGRCLFYRDHKRYMPYENCKDIRLCENPDDMPEFYQHASAMSRVNVHELVPQEPGGVIVLADAEAGQPTAARPTAIGQRIFSYRTACVEDHHFYMLLFWEAFMFCMTFEEPQPAIADAV